MEPELKIQIHRDAKIITHPFTDFFKGFGKVEAVRRLFGDKTDQVLRDLRVEFRSGRGYMGVSGEDGHLRVSQPYLKRGDKVDIYLDILHELVHVKQFMDGRSLFDQNFSYVDRPTEIEAFRCAVEEARRLGLSDERICDYLRTEWMSNDELASLAKTLNVRCNLSCK